MPATSSSTISLVAQDIDVVCVCKHSYVCNMAKLAVSVSLDIAMPATSNSTISLVAQDIRFEDVLVGCVYIGMTSQLATGTDL